MKSKIFESVRLWWRQFCREAGHISKGAGVLFLFFVLGLVVFGVCCSLDSSVDLRAALLGAIVGAGVPISFGVWKESRDEWERRRSALLEMFFYLDEQKMSIGSFLRHFCVDVNNFESAKLKERYIHRTIPLGSVPAILTFDKWNWMLGKENDLFILMFFEMVQKEYQVFLDLLERKNSGNNEENQVLADKAVDIGSLNRVGFNMLDSLDSYYIDGKSTLEMFNNLRGGKINKN